MVVVGGRSLVGLWFGFFLMWLGFVGLVKTFKGRGANLWLDIFLNIG